MKDMIINLILRGSNSGLNATLSQSAGRLQHFGGVARREFESIRRSAGSLQGKLAAMGVSFGAVILIKQSAELDRGLTRIGQTASESRVNVLGLRQEFFRMSKETGQSVENLKAGFDNAVQSGLNFKEALPVTDAVNKAMAVTGAQADQLTAGLTVAATAFRFDLAQPGRALGLLDRMTVAGRAGNAELENLSNIFARVGVNASRAGMGFDQTLGFIEGLSLLERQPERLSTLADSTLRLFTNIQYLSRAQKVTGVKFFDKEGGRRDPLAVLADIKAKYDKLKTAQQKEMFMGAAFKGADLDTIKGLQALFNGDMLKKVGDITKSISQAPGTITKDLPQAISNAVDQTGRLKTEMRKAADDFIMPLNDGIQKGIKKLLDAKKDGGLELSGKEIAGYGAAALGIGYMGYRLGGKAVKGFLGKLGRTGAGIAEGKAIEYATGVTPVFVTNWPGSVSDPMNPAAGNGPRAGSKALSRIGKIAGWAGPIGALAMLGNDYIEGGGSMDALSMGMMGMPAVSEMTQMPEVKNDIKISVMFDQYGRVITQTGDRNTNITVDLNRGTWADPLGAR
ncbi:MAG: phage tail tape measure protein [Deltaproteobacteria bacterium]|nr:phage tail tape measure protein [Deltaproteobacteria bacterium]